VNPKCSPKKFANPPVGNDIKDYENYRIKKIRAVREQALKLKMWRLFNWPKSSRRFAGCRDTFFI